MEIGLPLLVEPPGLSDPWGGPASTLSPLSHRREASSGYDLSLRWTLRELRERKRQLLEIASAAEREFRLDFLEKNGGNISKTARELGIKQQNLQTMLKRHDIRPWRDDDDGWSDGPPEFPVDAEPDSIHQSGEGTMSFYVQCFDLDTGTLVDLDLIGMPEVCLELGGEYDFRVESLHIESYPSFISLCPDAAIYYQARDLEEISPGTLTPRE